MSPHVTTATASEDKATLALQDKLDRLLAKAKPSKRELTQQHFRDLYPKLEAHLASGKLLKEVLAAFNELVQAKICARTFNEMLEQERGRRDDAGNPACCQECGGPLNAALRPKAIASDDTSSLQPTTTSENEGEI